jgi:hypothetical protein
MSKTKYEAISEGEDVIKWIEVTSGNPAVYNNDWLLWDVLNYKNEVVGVGMRGPGRWRAVQTENLKGNSDESRN